MSSQVLSDRDINAQPKPTVLPEKQEEKTKSLEYHRQMLQSRLQGEKSVFRQDIVSRRLTLNRTQQYVSPTDGIMSPATQKLSALRNRHVTKK